MHQEISSIAISGGFLDDAAAAFTGGLNRIIHSRNTGKAAVLGLVRHIIAIDGMDR